MYATVPYLRQPRCIRIFRTREQATYAQNILNKVSITSYIKEDGFGTLILKQLNMQSRFRLYLERDNIDKAGTFLAKVLKKILPRE